MVTWKYVQCGLCSWKAYCPIQKRNSRLRLHLRTKHRVDDENHDEVIKAELSKLREEIRELKHTQQTIKMINNKELTG